VIHVNDLLDAGSMQNAKERGLLRLEGKDYVVKDGDVIHFRFNV
jgi:ribosome-binding ATPase